MKDFLEDIWDEAEDFFEDFFEHLFRRKHKAASKQKTAVIDGSVTMVRPAYFFAERVDNVLRIVIGVSVLISALTSTYLGFASLSELVHVLINSLWGRLIMIVIGLSYLTIASWKLMHLKQKL